MPRLWTLAASMRVSWPSIKPRLVKAPVAVMAVVSPDISPLAAFSTLRPPTVRVWPASSLPWLVKLPVVV